MELLNSKFASMVLITFMLITLKLGSINFEKQVLFKNNISVKNSKIYDTIPDIIQDSISAIKIGKTILGIIYGEKYIKNCSPYYAELINNKDTWKVSGSGHKRFTTGGEPIILLHKKDARVIKFYHTR